MNRPLWRMAVVLLIGGLVLAFLTPQAPAATRPHRHHCHHRHHCPRQHGKPHPRKCKKKRNCYPPRREAQAKTVRQGKTESNMGTVSAERGPSIPVGAVLLLVVVGGTFLVGRRVLRARRPRGP